ncbi:DUF2800 domain-containing protein [Maledivibacter halophilus]|uniref:RecB family exonuclease n=1 Tax=Maledivibacter halophilus TaxID=36842 RepID=A0A1T5K355_9FIRM|nr:DUF2800 domain-containing protein [Maledivibacter halophilus]SKC58063.1 Protein of unknown function [Maledivibacter halophilus]
MTSHAYLSPSSSERWISCPPSIKLSEKFQEEFSSYAREGTEAHALCEHKLKKLLGLESKDPTENLEFYNEEMEDCAESYATYVMEVISRYREPLVLIEERLDLSKFAKESYGTADAIIVTDGELHVIDYKHGQGILVDANQNTQLMLYGLGALDLFDGIYDIEKVTMHIYQPRRENISTFEIVADKLYRWAEEVIIPKSKLAFNGEGEFESGDWCRFCKAKSICRERANVALEIARCEFKLPPLLSDEEVEEALKHVDQIESWIKDIKDYAFKRALEGRKWTDFKLVEGRSNRRYIDEDKVARLVEAEGFDPYEKKLKGITSMTKLLGKEKFNDLLSGLLEKPKGKTTLVARSDKRQEIETVKDEFQKEEI